MSKDGDRFRRYHQETIARNQASPLLRFTLREYCPPTMPKTALDIGSGAGVDATYLAEEGFTVTAVDPKPYGQYANQQISIVPTTIQYFLAEGSDRTYGLVLAMWSLPLLGLENPAELGALFRQIHHSLYDYGLFTGQLFGHDDFRVKRGRGEVLAIDQTEILPLFLGCGFQLCDLSCVTLPKIPARGGSEPLPHHYFEFIAQKA